MRTDRETQGKQRDPGVGNSYAIFGKTKALGVGNSYAILGIVEELIK